MTLTLVDTSILAPNGHRSLGALGRMLGLPKIELPEGAITKMREFLNAEPAKFNEYAVRDAEIAASYVNTIGRFFGEIGALGRGGRMPPTVGSAAVNLFRTIAENLRDRFPELSRPVWPVDHASARRPHDHLRGSFFRRT